MTCAPRWRRFSENMVYDDLDRHLPEAGSIERAAVPMGMYLAWCANLQLVSQRLTEQAEQLLLRVRYREVTGSELLVAGCAGELHSRWLNAEGCRFTDEYYAQYLADFASVFGGDIYGVKDDWAHYDEIAAVLTRHYMHGTGRRSAGRSAGRGGERKWWKFWN
ncbi:MAG: hypothetical protein OES38_04060 [Gammaproteobacteria bacterium]|nr:hypothetical protein [Gammaproteobacteria bacterium]